MAVLYKLLALLAMLAMCCGMELEVQLVNEAGDTKDDVIFNVDDNAIEDFRDSEDVISMISTKEKDEKREEYIKSAIVDPPVFGGRPRKLPKELEMHLTFGDGQYEPSWTEWSCCSKRNNQQTRTKTFNGKKEIMYRSCQSNYCTSVECVDKHFGCSLFPKDGCERTSRLFSLMDKLCPKTCNLCDGPVKSGKVPTTTKKPYRPTTTTRKPWRPTYTTRKPWRPTTTTKKPWRPTYTTRKPWRPTTTTRKPWSPTYTTRRPWKPTTKSTTTQSSRQTCHSTNDITTLYISYRVQNGIKLYRFSTSKYVSSPWTKVTQPANGELSSISLYTRSSGIYRVPIYFCRAGKGSNEKWQVSNRQCGSSGWVPVYTLYAAVQRDACATRMFGAKTEGAPWTSRISSSHICCGYTSRIFAFYAPDMNAGTKSGPTLPTYTYKPTTTAPPTTAAKVDLSSMNKYNRQCLEAHNFFRAVHGVPALKWSPTLAKSAQAWADQLKRIAPENPGKLVHPADRTRNWPHSQSNGPFRGYRVGENIAWDMSSDGSSAKETVLRWYSEIFYYDRRNPTISKPNRPVGHLTQLLWKETTEVGCGEAVHDFSFGRFETKSSYSVSHYNPTGNIHYRNVQDTNRYFEKMVPDYDKKTCMTKNSCKFENQCMAFGVQQTSTCQCQSQQPTCTGDNGCIAWCKRQSNRPTFYLWNEECRGSRTCRCTDTPINGVAGAICE